MYKVKINGLNIVQTFDNMINAFLKFLNAFACGDITENDYIACMKHYHSHIMNHVNFAFSAYWFDDSISEYERDIMRTYDSHQFGIWYGIDSTCEHTRHDTARGLIYHTVTAIQYRLTINQ